MKTYGSLFTGFGGACLGARAAGLELAWGNELDHAIAEVGNYNLGGHIRVGDVLEENPHDYERVDVLHASPPCPNFSVAKAGGAETELDIALARKVTEFVTVLRPEVFTLENVQAYQKSKSWALIEQTLWDAGYWLSVNIVNSADFGVAQTRRRMIARAVRGGWVPYLPQPVPWIGWHSAIEDILHTLPDSQFAPWQLARLPEELRTMLVAQGKYGDDLVMAQQDNITANSNQLGVRALLVSNAKTEYSDGTRSGDDPAFTVTGESNGRVKAFLVGKHYDAPSSADERHVQVKAEHEPSMTVTASDKNECRGLFDGGRVVAMTPLALARFQSFPDGTMYPGSVRLLKPYILPDSKTLAAKGLGNAVPPLVMQRIYEGLLGA